MKKRSKPNPNSDQPYLQRSEVEMLEIVKEIHENGLLKKTVLESMALIGTT